jgi:hypothetical protein
MSCQPIYLIGHMDNQQFSPAKQPAASQLLEACDLQKREPSPDFSDEGFVDRSVIGYFLQHSPGQHFAFPLQQSAASDVAGVVPMNAAKVAIKRRYFIRSSFFSFVCKTRPRIQSRRAGAFRKCPARRWKWRTLSPRRSALVSKANGSEQMHICREWYRSRKIKRATCRLIRTA